MRIAIFQYSANKGGSTISCKILVEYLINQSHEVEVIFGFDGPCRLEFEEIGAACRVIKHRSYLGSKSLRRRFEHWFHSSRREVRRFLTEREVDLVYINTTASGQFLSLARQLGISTILHIRELPVEFGGELPLLNADTITSVSRYVNKNASQVIAVSQIVRDKILEKVEPSKIHVIPNAVSDAFFEESRNSFLARKQLGLPSDLYVIGIPGTIRKVKGLREFLAVAKVVVTENPRVLFCVTGSLESSYSLGVKKLYETELPRESICFTGDVDFMPSFYRACDLICLPSLSESFGRTAIEAMAIGTPVIANDVGGLREIVQDGVYGLLVSDNNCGHWVSAIKHCIAEQASAAAIACQAKAFVSERFAADAVGNSISKVIELAVSTA